MSDLEQKSIERIKMGSEMALHNYGHPLVCTYSGGKDSDVMLELFKRSGVPFTVHCSHTTVDAPPTVRHIFETFHQLEDEGIKCEIDFHEYEEGGRKKRITMWNLIPIRYMPPTRIVRYCCSELKESSTKGLMIATGVRWAESIKRRDRDAFEALARKKTNRIALSDEKMLLTDNEDTRRLIERCQMKGEVVVNPIIDWPDNEIWDFYRHECKSHNEIYEMGYHRAGCVGCPMATVKMRWRNFNDFPTYKDAYIRAFDKMLIERKKKNLDRPGHHHKFQDWTSGEAVFKWWMNDDTIEGQMSIYDFLNEEDYS